MEFKTNAFALVFDGEVSDARFVALDETSGKPYHNTFRYAWLTSEKEARRYAEANEGLSVVYVELTCKILPVTKDRV
jgi:hypothetical protein